MRAWNPYFCLNSLNCNGFKPTFCVYRTTIILYEEFFGGFQGDELVGGEYGVEVAVRQLGGEFHLYAFVFPHHFKWFDAVIGDDPMLLVLFVK